METKDNIAVSTGEDAELFVSTPEEKAWNRAYKATLIVSFIGAAVSLTAGIIALSPKLRNKVPKKTQIGLSAFGLGITIGNFVSSRLVHIGNNFINNELPCPEDIEF